MKTSRFTRHRQPFKCAECGKMTTGAPGVVGPELCGNCYERAGIANEHSDTGGKHYGAPLPCDNCPTCELDAANAKAEAIAASSSVDELNAAANAFEYVTDTHGYMVLRKRSK